MAVNVGGDNPLATQPPHVFAEHGALLGLQLKTGRHTWRMSIRSETADAGGQDNAPRAKAGDHDVHIADLEGPRNLDGRGYDLAEAGGEQTQQRVPGQARDVAADEHEAGGAIDDSEQASEDDPGRQEREEGRQPGHASKAMRVLARRQCRPSSFRPFETAPTAYGELPTY